MWIPERVWEQSLTSDLVAAGIQYTLLDDFHFKNAGLTRRAVARLLCDRGRRATCCTCFPGSERLRYLIPFRDAARDDRLSAPVCRAVSRTAVVVFGDDGEKFGTWPDTKQHVYDDGWLRQFFDVLTENQDWLHTTTLAEAMQSDTADGQDLPSRRQLSRNDRMGSARRTQLEYEHLSHEMEHDPRWHASSSFVRGGFWRNFKVKYPETDEMYCRMMMVSRRLEEARENGVSDEEFDRARVENCTAASAIAAIGTAPSAASTCRTCEMPSSTI